MLPSIFLSSVSVWLFIVHLLVLLNEDFSSENTEPIYLPIRIFFSSNFFFICFLLLLCLWGSSRSPVFSINGSFLSLHFSPHVSFFLLVSMETFFDLFFRIIWLNSFLYWPLVPTNKIPTHTQERHLFSNFPSQNWFAALAMVGCVSVSI